MVCNIAAIFHWPLSELRELEVDELVTFNAEAVKRSGVTPE